LARNRLIRPFAPRLDRPTSVGRLARSANGGADDIVAGRQAENAILSAIVRLVGSCGRELFLSAHILLPHHRDDCKGDLLVKIVWQLVRC
jgi:hypothetical protein